MVRSSDLKLQVTNSCHTSLADHKYGKSSVSAIALEAVLQARSADTQ